MDSTWSSLGMEDKAKACSLQRILGTTGIADLLCLENLPHRIIVFQPSRIWLHSLALALWLPPPPTGSPWIYISSHISVPLYRHAHAPDTATLEHLLSAKSCVKCFIGVILLSQLSWKIRTVRSPVLQIKNRGSERQISLPRVSQQKLSVCRLCRQSL